MGKISMKSRMRVGTVFGTMLLGAAASSANATEIFTSNATIGGTVFSFGPSARPWVAQVFAAANECLRLDVTTQFTDLEIVAVAPNGSVFRNDDRAAGDNRPLVNIRPTPNNGWYTVSI